MSGYKDIIKKGREEEKGKAVNTDVGKVVNTAPFDERRSEDEKHPSAKNEQPVNITIKVPKKSRQYWTSQCKLEGLTMTEVLVEALTKRFGEPQ